uniref:monocarboxylate transporter 12-B-like n=1 Tax=Styela clava TaxID=7725 RepID=UPI00193A8513|nr:monocarboxylate transporter 12-B-like [Styela clava]
MRYNLVSVDSDSRLSPNRRPLHLFSVLIEILMAGTAGEVPTRQPPNAVLPDSKWSWLVVCGNTVIGITTLGFFRCIPVYFRPIMLEFDAEFGDVAAIMGLFTLGMALGCFFLPFLTSKFGSKRTCLAAGFLLGIANIVSSQSHTLVLVQIFLGFISGCSAGILFFTSLFSSSQYFVKHRAKATGISTLGLPMGTLVIAPILELLTTLYGWRGSLLIASGILFHSCVSAMLYRPVILAPTAPRRKSTRGSISGIRKKSTPTELKEFSKSKISSDSPQFDDHDEKNPMTKLVTPTEKSDFEITREMEVASNAQQNKNSCNSTFKNKVKSIIDVELFKLISYDIGLLSSIFYCSGYVGANTFLIPYALEHVHIDTLQASTILSLLGGAECVAKIVTGFLGDVKCINKCILLAIMAVVCSIIVATITVCESYLSLAVITFAYGLFVTAYMGIIPVIFCDIVGPKKLATAVGYQGCIYNSFLALYLYLMGRLVDRTGDVRQPFYSCATLIGLTSFCLIAIFLLERRQKKVNKMLADIES